MIANFIPILARTIPSKRYLSATGTCRPATMALAALLLFSIALIGCSPTDAQHLSPFENTDADKRFQSLIRDHIANKTTIQKGDSEFSALFSKTSFPKEFTGFSLVFYSPENKRIVIIKRAQSGIESIRNAINRAMVHPRIEAFDLKNLQSSRIQIDFILGSFQSISASRLLSDTRSWNRFEFGVDGLRLSVDDRVVYLLPGDAFVRSLLGPGQLARYVRKLFPESELSDLYIQRFRSESYVSYNDEWIRLYRGIPVIGEIAREDLEQVSKSSVDYLLRTQTADGKFMYYYNAANDSFRNHEHPSRDPQRNPYYNILRHVGGALTYLYYYDYTADDKVIDRIELSIEYLLKNLRHYETEAGEPAAYVFYNSKAKLGGSGLALYLLSEYQRISGDDKYEKFTLLLNEHVLSEIRDDGEFYYYHIYPGREKTDLRSFSFFYPGEALIGLASYVKNVEKDPIERERIIKKMKMALQFLLVERKSKYRSHYKSLPSDSWLMMAVSEAWEIPEMQQELYKEFVFRDADQMVRHMYRKGDAPFPDYVGSFYYDVGDHPYADGARAEGLTAAIQLARQVGDQERVKRYGDALKAAAWATLHLVNTPQSTYSVPNPEMTIDGIRFKLTRQWFRVDTIQHVASFYLKFLPYWSDGELFDPSGPEAEAVDSR